MLAATGPGLNGKAVPAACRAPAGGRRPEIDLLVTAARVDATPARDDETRRLVRHGLDWEYLLTVAGRHGLRPVLHQHLNTTCPEAVPVAVRGRLRAQFQANARRNLLLTGELLQLLSQFRAHDIPALPHKGPALAVLAYGNLALREFGDLDVLIRRRDFARARDLLLARGYSPKYQLTAAQEAAYLRAHWEYVFLRPDRAVALEIHWRTTPRAFSFPLDQERLWRRLETLPLGGAQVLTLPPEELLLILCVHGSKHGWDRLCWVADIARLIHAPRGLDWGRVLAQAGRAGSDRMLFLGLFLASGLLRADLPPPVRQRMKSQPAAQALAQEVCERLYEKPDAEPPGTVGMMRYHLRCLEQLRKQIYYCLDVLAPPGVADWQAVALPPSLGFLYHLARPIRLAVKYAAALVRRPR
jgi:hypothetical protein